MSFSAWPGSNLWTWCHCYRTNIITAPRSYVGGYRRRTVFSQEFNHCCLSMYYGYIFIAPVKYIRSCWTGPSSWHWSSSNKRRSMHRSTGYLAAERLRENIGSCVERVGFFGFQLSNKISSNKSNQSWKIEDIIMSWSREKVLKINSARALGGKNGATPCYWPDWKLLHGSALIICPPVHACTTRRRRACVFWAHLRKEKHGSSTCPNWSKSSFAHRKYEINIDYKGV